MNEKHARFIIKHGRFGAYFYDTLIGADVDLPSILKMLNAKELFFESEEKGSEVNAHNVCIHGTYLSDHCPECKPPVKLKVYQKEIIQNSKTRRKVIRISSKPCKYCNGRISWDDYETTGKPIHVDEDGYEVAGCKN